MKLYIDVVTHVNEVSVFKYHVVRVVFNAEILSYKPWRPKGLFSI